MPWIRAVGNRGTSWFEPVKFAIESTKIGDKDGVESVKKWEEHRFLPWIAECMVMPVMEERTYEKKFWRRSWWVQWVWFCSLSLRVYHPGGHVPLSSTNFSFRSQFKYNFISLPLCPHWFRSTASHCQSILYSFVAHIMVVILIIYPASVFCHHTISKPYEIRDWVPGLFVPSIVYTVLSTVPGTANINWRNQCPVGQWTHKCVAQETSGLERWMWELSAY